jgi:hypothetical protein
MKGNSRITVLTWAYQYIFNLYIKMKHCILLVLISCSFFQGSSQWNLVLNSGFEHLNPGQSLNTDCLGGITQDVMFWTQANDRHDYKYGTPDLMDENCLYAQVGIHYSGLSSKFVYLEVQHDGNGTHPSHNQKNDAIQIGLISPLYQIHNYVFKIVYLGVSPKYGNPILYGNTRMRMWLSKYSRRWNSSWGNSIYSRAMYPPQAGNPQGWVEHTLFIDGPNDAANFSQLKNLTIGAEENQIYVESVELSEICAPIHYIQDQQFYFAQEGIPHKAGHIFVAGNNLGTPHLTGDVIIHSGANVTFKTGDQTGDYFYFKGFDVRQGANFETIFEHCNNWIQREAYDTTEVYSFDDTIEYLDCGDTLVIHGLDGDTSSYTNYFWDFGNGDTLTAPSVNYVYPNSGTYLVKLILTDSLNYVDTLSKTYIVPACRVNGTEVIPDYQPAIKVFPNPSTGLISVNYISKDKNYLSYSIYDPSGRILVPKTKEYFNDFQIKIDYEGVYFIKFEFENKIIQYRKVVIAK